MVFRWPICWKDAAAELCVHGFPEHRFLPTGGRGALGEGECPIECLVIQFRPRFIRIMPGRPVVMTSVAFLHRESPRL